MKYNSLYNNHLTEEKTELQPLNILHTAINDTQLIMVGIRI